MHFRSTKTVLRFKLWLSIFLITGTISCFYKKELERYHALNSIESVADRLSATGNFIRDYPKSDSLLPAIKSALGILEKTGDNVIVQISDWEGVMPVTVKVVINSAGLNSDQIAQLAGIDVDQAKYRLHYCKGDYWSLGTKWKTKVSRLIYPTPEAAGLGIHLTLGIDDRMRLGPSAQYIDEIDYKVDTTQKDAFYKSASEYLPFIEKTDLQPEFAGIRPKLQAQNMPFRDFVISSEQNYGLPGLINLIGIESPGLTASPAIARHVGKIVTNILN